MMGRSPSQNQSPAWPFSLGAPVWACDAWAGIVYPPGTPRRDWLNWYSRTFNIVEGNSTFYGLPGRETFSKWVEQTVAGFEFSFKFPRRISHELELRGCDEPLADFLDRLAILARGQRLGPTFLQLGPQFGPDRWDTLASFLRGLPSEFPWAVEVRHAGWFDSASDENRLDDLLRDLSIDKVLFDSRPLFASPPDDEIETVSQSRKPRSPLRQTVTADRPMLRIVGRNRVEKADAYLAEWAPVLVDWIAQGKRPIVFTHAPDDAKAPEFARRFMTHLRDAAVVQPALSVTDWTIPVPPSPPKQLSLLDDFS